MFFTRSTFSFLMAPDEDGAGGQTANTPESPTSSNSGNAGVNSSNTPPMVPFEEYRRLQSELSGLRGHIKNEVNPKMSDLERQLKDAQAQLETGNAHLIAQREEALRQAEDLKAQHEAAQSELRRLQHQSEVSNTIASDPELASLAPLQAQGLLRTDGLEGEELTGYLKQLASVASAAQNNGVKQTLQGTTPPIPEGTDSASLSEDQVYDMMMNLNPLDPAQKQRYDELQRLYEQKTKKS